MTAITVHPVLERVLRIGGDRVMPSPDNDFWSIALNRSRRPSRVVTIDKDEKFAHITIALAHMETCLQSWNLKGKAKPKREQRSGGWVFYIPIDDFKAIPDDFIEFIIESRASI